MFTRLLLALFIALTFVCGGIAIYYNRVFEGLQVSLADTKAQLAATQARLKERQSEPPAAQSKPLPSSDPKGSR